MALSSHSCVSSRAIAPKILRGHALTYFPLQKSAGETQQSDYEKKKANFITRGIWTLIMIGGFFAALFMGHIYIILIITIVQIISFKEVIAIASVPTKARQLRSTKSLNWYWLATTMYFLYGESVIYYFKHVVLVDKMLLPLATHHRFISFILYIIGTSRCAQELQHSAGGRASSAFGDVRLTLSGRICLLCRILEGWPPPLPVYSIRVDAYGPPHHCGAGPLHHE